MKLNLRKTLLAAMSGLLFTSLYASDYNDYSDSCDNKSKTIRYFDIGYENGRIEFLDRNVTLTFNGIKIGTSVLNYYGDIFFADLHVGVNGGIINHTNGARYADVEAGFKMGVYTVPSIDFGIYIGGGYKYGYFSDLNSRYYIKGFGYKIGAFGQFLASDSVDWFAEYNRYFMKGSDEDFVYRYGVGGLIFKF